MKPCYNLYWNAIGKISLCKVSVISCPLLATILKWQQTHNARWSKLCDQLALLSPSCYICGCSLFEHPSFMSKRQWLFLLYFESSHAHTCSWDDSTQCQWACMCRYVCTLTTKSCWSFFILPSELESRMRDRRGWLPLSLPVSTSAHRTLLLNKCGRKKEAISPNPTFHKKSHSLKMHNYIWDITTKMSHKLTICLGSSLWWGLGFGKERGAMLPS